MTTGAKARRSQLLSTYGIGGLFPSETTSFMIAGLDEWKEERAIPVSEPRLARSLRVSELRMPPAGTPRDVPVIRFPLTQVCPACRRLGSLHDLSKDWNIAKCAQCKDKAELTPFRLIVVCQNGHIDEFPYFRWLHKGKSPESEDHKMSMQTLGKSSSLADLVLECSCGVEPRSLDGTFGPNALAEFGKCKGARPWLGPDASEDCTMVPRVLQRGASNVWLPAVRSAISIPPYSDALAKYVDKCWWSLEDREEVSDRFLERMAAKSNGKFTAEQIRGEAERRWADEEDSDLDENKLRKQEFEALMEGREDEGVLSDFVCLTNELKESPSPWDVPDIITHVNKVTRLREVRALYGFSRLDGVTEAGMDGLCDLSVHNRNWLPAVEVIGEGVFVALDRKRLDEWAESNFVRSRRDDLQRAAIRRAAEFNRPAAQIDIVKVAVHTLAHVLVDELSLDAGYPAAALRERLFVDNDMAGLLIYTASSDSAGSLGGLAAQAEKGRFTAAMREGLHRLSWCSSDPVCVETTATGSGALNLAACHACVLVAETSCELNNTYLDRALLFGSPENGHEDEGLFSDYIALS